MAAKIMIWETALHNSGMTFPTGNDKDMETFESSSAKSNVLNELTRLTHGVIAGSELPSHTMYSTNNSALSDRRW
jgi:hypothetical protein